MAKITYLLGAGASYYSCPILENQAEMMIAIANLELTKLSKKQSSNRNVTILSYGFNKPEVDTIPDDNKLKILWYIGYFGKKAIEYNTIDTYARKLFLNDEKEELSLLKMSVSVFFDLWENFYETRYKYYYSEKEYPSTDKIYAPFKKVLYNKIDNRYKSLFSVLLNKSNQGEIELNNEFKFITWNYDLQLESTFKTFLKDGQQTDNNKLNELFTFKSDDDNKRSNDVFHLNGHRGFYNITNGITENRFGSFEEYWSNNSLLFRAVTNNDTHFNNHIKYAWEHNLNDLYFQKISNILGLTEILIIIGYSFPAFNRKIDQFLFSKINNNRIKKIVYQDPNATVNMIENLFEKPERFKDKIEVITDSKELKQFYLPNDFFISQENNKGNYDLR